MTKKDYILLADAFKGYFPLHRYEGGLAKTALARRVADALEKDNPRFNREKFLAACGVES